MLVVRFAGEPIAQAFVLRWVLEGGISTDRWSFGGFHASTVSPFCGVPGTCGGCPGGYCLAHCWVLRQQDRGVRGFWLRVFPGLFVSGFLAAPIMHGCFFLRGGRVCGVCGTGLLFENYIVDASIFYKKQFPRI